MSCYLELKTGKEKGEAVLKAISELPVDDDYFYFELHKTCFLEDSETLWMDIEFPYKTPQAVLNTCREVFERNGLEDVWWTIIKETSIVVSKVTELFPEIKLNRR